MRIWQARKPRLMAGLSLRILLSPRKGDPCCDLPDGIVCTIQNQRFPSPLIQGRWIKGSALEEGREIGGINDNGGGSNLRKLSCAAPP